MENRAEESEQQIKIDKEALLDTFVNKPRFAKKNFPELDIEVQRIGEGLQFLVSGVTTLYSEGLNFSKAACFSLMVF